MTEFDMMELLIGVDERLLERADASVSLFRKPRFRAAFATAAVAVLLAVTMIASPIAVVVSYGNAHPEIEGGLVYVMDAMIKDEEHFLYSLLPESAKNTLGSVLDALKGGKSENESETETETDAAPANQGLKFSHSLQGQVAAFTFGSSFEITVNVTNVGDHELIFSTELSDNVIPEALIRMGSKDLLPASVHTEDGLSFDSIAAKESKSITYTFDLPEAPGYSAFYRYNLMVSLGEYSYIFENAVLIAPEGFENKTDVKEQFEEFLLANTPDEFDMGQYRSILESYSYQGLNILKDHMTIKQVDDGNMRAEAGGSDLFYYVIASESTLNNRIDHSTCYFRAEALPDGMTLPMGITEQDDLLSALDKMGYDKALADALIKEFYDIPLAYDPPASSDGPQYASSLYVDCNFPYHIITCEYVPQVFDGQTPNVKKSLNLYYKADDLSFLYAETKMELLAPDNITLSETACVGQVYDRVIWNEDFSRPTFTAEQREQLQKILNSSRWEYSTQYPHYLDCSFADGDMIFEYSSKDGMLKIENYVLRLSNEDRIAFNKLLESIALSAKS